LIHLQRKNKSKEIELQNNSAFAAANVFFQDKAFDGLYSAAYPNEF